MAYTEFFVTTGGSASDVNGGGPSLGAAGAPVYTTADSTIAGLFPAIVVDNSGSDWAGASVDDWICWDTAGVKEFRRITALAGANATIHANGTVAANKTTNVGGAWATVDHGLSTIDTTFVNAAGDFPSLNIKEGTYAESVVVDNSGTLAIPITCEGYKTTAHDNPPLANLPEIDANGTGNVAFDASTKDYIIIRRLNIHCDDANMSAVRVQSHCLIDSVKAKSTHLYGFHSSGSKNNFINCWADTCGNDGFRDGVGYNTYIGCYADTCVDMGFVLSAYSMCICCIADSCGDDGFYVALDTMGLFGCVAYNCGTTAGSGIHFFDLVDEKQGMVVNCILVGNQAYGIEVDAASKYLQYEDYNAFYNNGTAATLNCLESGDNDVTLTADPFVNAAGGDFRINTAAGGGALLRAVGFPGTMLDGINVGHMDIGTLQTPASRWARPYRGI